MAQMNLSTKQKHTHRQREQTVVVGVGWGRREKMDWEIGLVDVNYYT